MTTRSSAHAPSPYNFGNSYESPPSSPTEPLTMLNPWKSSERFFINDSMIDFLVEDTRYRVHRYFFEQYSADFAVKYKFPEKCNSATTPHIRLDDVKTRDFEQLLSIFYPSTLASTHPDTKTVEDWTSILRLATKWNFSSLRELAVERLSSITSPIGKVVLAHTFDLPQWLPDAYTQLCERRTPLTADEGRQLGELGHVGVDIVVRLWQACHQLRSPRSLDRDSAGRIVKTVFEIDDPNVESPPDHEVGSGDDDDDPEPEKAAPRECQHDVGSQSPTANINGKQTMSIPEPSTKHSLNCSPRTPASTAPPAYASSVPPATPVNATRTGTMAATRSSENSHLRLLAIPATSATPASSSSVPPATSTNTMGFHWLRDSEKSTRRVATPRRQI